jgi:hypothetical protein
VSKCKILKKKVVRTRLCGNAVAIFMAQHKNLFQEKIATLAAKVILVCAISLLFHPEQPFLDKI